jgi:hypothetical protein
MPVDPNIALGVRPVEIPNMLGQMAQAMQIRQANQEYDDTNAMRSIAAKYGGDISNPDFIKEVGMRSPKTAADLRAKALANDKTTGEIVKSRLETSRELLSNVRTPEEYLAWHQGNHKDPLIGPLLASKGITADTSMATIQESLRKPGGFEELLKKSAMGLEKFYQDQTSRRIADVTSGPGYLQAGIAREKLTQDQAELARVRGILTGGAPPPAAFPAAGNAPMGGGGQLGSGTFGIPTGVTPTPSTGAVARPNVLATQVAPQTTFAPNVNGLNPTAPSRVEDITRQITQLAKVGGPVANQALEGLIKEYNVLNPAGKIEIDSTGTLRTINERSGVSTVVTGADGKSVRGNVTPIIKSVLDQTDPAGKRMIDVNVNEYVQGTGLGADGKGATPKGVIGISNSPLQPNYMPDPKNPQGVIPVPGSPADPNAVVPSGYRPRPDGKGLEFIPGGPQDPKIQAAQNTVKLSTKDREAREAKYPQATSAIKSFDAKTDKFDRDIAELLANEKGLNEITGFFSGRTDLSAMSKDARRALALFNTITAKGGFSELQDMRNASPTGGALGNVSNQEGGQLIASFGALSRTQDANDVRKSLTNARADLQNLKTRMREAYDLTYEYRNSGNTPALPSGFKAD